VIIGAGPAGLTASYELMKHDIPTTVIEKDPKYVGGLARTVEHKGYRSTSVVTVSSPRTKRLRTCGRRSSARRC